MKISALESPRVEKPIAQDARPSRRPRPELMHHYIIGMHTQEHVGENGIIKNPVEILGIDVAYGQRARIAAHGETVAFRDRHEPAEERAGGEIVLRCIIRS